MCTFCSVEPALPSARSGPARSRSSRSLQAAAERAGLEGIGLHTLRHSAASALIADGVSVKVVQELLGHASYAITADIYAHVGAAQQRDAADRLGAVFGS